MPYKEPIGTGSTTTETNLLDRTQSGLSSLRAGSANMYGGTGNLNTVGGTANAVTLTTDPASPAHTAYTNGHEVTFLPGSTNTTGLTSALDGMAAKAWVKRQAGALVALVAGDTVANIPTTGLFSTQADSYILQVPAQSRSYAAGSNVIITGSYQSTISSSYTKLKEFYIPFSGVFTIDFDLDLSASGTTGLGRIYRNGVAIGTERSVTPGTSPQTFSESISGWSPGDLLQIYGRSADGNNVLSINNSKLKALNPLIITEVL